jgi:Pectate lyase superfamily protein
MSRDCQPFVLAIVLVASSSASTQVGPVGNVGHLSEVRSARQFVTHGAGTSSDPFASNDGTGGIQGAIDSCPSTGCHVLVPGGNYEVSRSIFIKSNIWLSGEGMGLTIIKRKAGTQTEASDVSTGPILTAFPSPTSPLTATRRPSRPSRQRTADFKASDFRRLLEARLMETSTESRFRESK